MTVPRLVTAGHGRVTATGWVEHAAAVAANPMTTVISQGRDLSTVDTPVSFSSARKLRPSEGSTRGSTLTVRAGCGPYSSAVVALIGLAV
jgi:hypothetical protein